MGLRPECLLGPPYYTVVPCPHWMLLSKKYYLKKNVLASISLNILMLFFSALIHHLEHQAHFVRIVSSLVINLLSVS
uniref:Uncharacterized protein n=1 Tax=Cucumis melo TaxID=3656 RepID=A0A9I9EBI8_CUCME